MEVSIQSTEIKPKQVNLTDNAVRVLEARYLKKNENSEVIEKPEDLFWRVAKCVASVEKNTPNITEDDIKKYEIDFFNLMAEGFFMPNSPTLMNAGREMGMLSACFVLPVEDSIHGIFKSIQNTALIQKAGGGTGFSFSRLRPKGDIVRSSGGTTSGPLSFIKVFSEATEAIQQGAFRRGANMGIMHIYHPDIIDFINAKQDLTKLTNFNLSISVPNDFMEDLKSNPDKIHMVKNPRTNETYPLLKQDSPEKYWTVSEVFNVIVDRAWESGEPGILFIDRINEVNPTPHLGDIEATNPCGEQPLLPYEACNLGSINLSKFVRIDKQGERDYDYDALRKIIHASVRFLDNVVDANNYPLAEIEKMCKGNRKIGLGVMGFADALYLLRMPYTSEEGIAFGEKVMKFINDESHIASQKLAEKKGVFPNWPGSVWDTQKNRKMRNAATTTVAPTGTVSIIADCSSGIEPLFSLSFYRNVLNGQKLVETNRVFKMYAQEKGFHSEELSKKLAEGVSLQEMENIDDQAKKIFITAHDVEPSYHIGMQAAFQKNCDSSISKTINFTNSATKEEVEQIYRLAYEHRVKGVTVYRDGCRQNQPMAHEKEKKESDDKCINMQYIKPVKIPEIMSCLRIRQKTPFGNMHVKISVEPVTGKEREVFAQLGRGGDVANSDLEAICRMLSLFLRCNGSLTLAVKQLDGIGSSLSVPSKDGRVMSLADGLAKAIKKYSKAKETFGIRNLLLGEIDADVLAGKKTLMSKSGSSSIGSGMKSSYSAFKIKCPECNNILYFEEGCIKCHACGYSHC
ncbi:MAG: vitamin B12-dependent ribonucleotide reductase [Candidatus Aureabacteria bacterium]|nr:vitamin B12-dependent ribonucleotide reductase [Candidatus Auribacterota bacterium]